MGRLKIKLFKNKILEILGRDVCVGDSGGPLLLPFRSDPGSEHLSGKLFQAGIISYGSSFCGSGSGGPSVFTRVISYIDWILSTMLVDRYYEYYE